MIENSKYGVIHKKVGRSKCKMPNAEFILSKIRPSLIEDELTG
jgi:hypothetical protein